MKKLFFVVLGVVAASIQVFAQIDAGLFRFPDVSKTHIVFTYANDIWVVPKEGGTATKLSSPPGVESMPKFSPDGKNIAFSGNYDGNSDVYMMPVAGGVPKRLTYHGSPDRVVDWQPDGQRIVFASSRESEKDRFNKFFSVSVGGGPIDRLPFAYAEFGSYSPDGKSMAVVFRTEVFRTWKRYRGGDVADIYVFNLADKSSENISSSIAAGEELPMWHGNSIYFLSDNGPEKRSNLWQYDVATRTRKQLTSFSDYDVHFPSLGPDEIVFEAGGKLQLYSLADGSVKTVSVNVVSDRASLKPTVEVVEKYIQHAAISYDGNRVLMEARGDIFSLPAEHGFIKNLTQSTGTAQRYPAWSPDGKTIAYWSDESGEYELWLYSTETNSSRKVTNFGPGYRYRISWAPDSKKIAFIDKAMLIKVIDVTTGQIFEVDRGHQKSHYALEGFRVSWSPDSRWLAYNRDLTNGYEGIFVFDFQTKKTREVTSGYYSAFNPVFDSEGKYLYVLSTQTFQPLYSSIDNTFIYPNSTQIAAISLKSTTPSLIAPRNETVEIKAEVAPAPDAKDTKGKSNGKKEDKDKDKDEKPAVVPVEIDFEGIERRLVLLPMKAGNYYQIASTKGKIIYHKGPNTGSDSDAKSSMRYWDIEKREEKTILDDVNDFMMSADGKRALVSKNGASAVIKVEENQKFEKPLRVAEMEMLVDPVQEWKQLFMDAWRLERDYFYDARMHGVDWNLVKERYLRMLAGVMTREEVNFVLGEMIGELNASHTYRSGGDEETAARKNVGYLGIDWKAEGEYYRVGRIIRAASWDAEVRSPLDLPGVNVREGDYILAVNGMPISTKLEPSAFFQGLGDKTVEITYNGFPTTAGAKTVVLQLLSGESRLRHLAWIESNRKRVYEATNGEVGYVYVPDTGVGGQNELVRQFRAQIDKKGLVIDERFNSGGQIPDRFVELLDREPLAFWAIRDGSEWQWPPVAHFGPKVMLINGWSGSGGDAFPDYFKKKKLGPLVGARTWGGLIGISGAPTLIDGGSVTVPTFRMFNPDGSWFKEGYGVDPDIEVQEDLTAMANGKDAQLERAIAEMQLMLKQYAFGKPARPLAESR